MAGWSWSWGTQRRPWRRSPQLLHIGLSGSAFCWPSWEPARWGDKQSKECPAKSRRSWVKAWSATCSTPRYSCSTDLLVTVYCKFLLPRHSQWLRYFLHLFTASSTNSLCTSYLPSQVSYSLRRLTAFQTQNLYIGPQPESELPHTNAPGLSVLFPGAEAKPDPIKGGLRVTSFFNYNCLAVSLSV